MPALEARAGHGLDNRSAKFTPAVAPGAAGRCAPISTASVARSALVHLASETEVDDSESIAAEARAPANATTLAGEVRMLEAARSEILAGRAGAAIEILDGCRRDFPNGRLALEADVLRIESLFRIGRASTAIGLANKFLAANPKSPLANRVRALARAEPALTGDRSAGADWLQVVFVVGFVRRCCGQQVSKAADGLDLFSRAPQLPSDVGDVHAH
jgi:hypothetical protein